MDILPKNEKKPTTNYNTILHCTHKNNKISLVHYAPITFCSK